MRNSWIRFTGAAALAAGMLLAQAPAPPDQSQPPAGQHQMRQARMFDRLVSTLNLTDDQQQQVKSILQSAHQSSRPIAQQLRQDRQSLRAAIQAGKPDADLNQISGDIGSLTGQLTAMRSKTFAKIYALLTPDQRTQAQAMFDRVRARSMARRPGGQEGQANF